MFLTSKIKSSLIAFALILPFSFTGLLHAQQGSYIGTENSLSENELFAKATDADFGNNISTKIFEDVKNTYFAVDVSKLSSKYEKIRILELSYEDKALVSMGSDENTTFYFFLVNNTLNKSTEEIVGLLNDFLTRAKTELQAMNSEQLRLWLIQHDKYSKN